ncbi:MAG: hypothetical protein Tp1124SUR1244132_35 [Prokaryotic dsDNA virus sp.]|nr:MAG: hypothetical protein Tp1124SUR1244132_35 [Prokaryotic dsDNA virus sp.]|tara:strand:- start:1163 stop:2041 length:879 start_codon:yes stop_codon:yes gene_type:complete
MKLAIPTHNRSEIISTPFLEVFKNFDIYLIFHSNEAYKEYSKKNDLSNINIVVTDIEPASNGTGLPLNRKYFLENYVEHNEWIIFADDNVASIEGLISENLWNKFILQNNQKNLFSEWNSDLFFKRINEIKNYADTVGAYHVGLQTSKNYFYAHKKYRERGYVLGKLTLWKKDNNFIYDTPFTAMEDFHHTAMHLIHYGKVLICDYVWANAKHFQGGGLGSKNFRKPNHIQSVEYLTAKYPQLIKVKNRKDNYPDLRFPNMSEYNFQVWLKQYKAFKKEYIFNEDTFRWDKK